MAARNGVWFLAVPVVVIVACLSVESLPPGEPTGLPRHVGRSSPLAPFLRFVRSGPTHADPAVNLKIAATNAGPLVPITVSTLLPDARTFFVDVDLNHDGRFEGAGELTYATGRFDEAGIGELRLHGLIDGRYRARVRVDGIHGETVSAVQKFELSPPRNNHLPISFEVNRGQTDSSVLFVGRAKNQMVFVTRGETVLVTTTGRAELRKEPVDSRPTNSTAQATQFATRFRLASANSWAQPTGHKMLPGKANYFIGNDPSQWRANIATYEELLSRDVYPGIDLIYYSRAGRLAYDFRIAAGADPSVIALEFPDVSRLSIDADGELMLHLPGGDVLRKSAPLMYQEGHGQREAVKGDWVLRGSRQAGYAIAAYDRGRELVIDPILFSTYFGGAGNDLGRAIGLDAAGNIYVAGDTTSANYPTTAGSFQTAPWAGPGTDAFVVKLNPSGTAVLYSTYLGGPGPILVVGPNKGESLAVDGAGNAYVTGTTTSNAFPTTAGVFQPAQAGGQDGFVAKLNPTGTALVYSTYLGGTLFDGARSIAIDAAGNAFVGGYTESANFPTTAGVFQSVIAGTSNCFVAKLNPAGTGLIYSSFLGGAGAIASHVVFGLAIDAAGNSYATGWTSSATFPTTAGAYQTVLAGPQDAFVAKVNPTGSTLVYSTYLGGSNVETGSGVAVDAGGNAYICGTTSSNDFPITPGSLQSTFQGGGTDAFVTKLNPTGSVLVYSTYLGGTGSEQGSGIALDAAGNASMTGQTSGLTFPITLNATQATYGGGASDAFVAQLNPTGASLLFSTFIGGSGADQGGPGGVPGTYGRNPVIVDASGNMYVTGGTDSVNFPTWGPIQAANAGGQDFFITKLTPNVPPPPPPQPIGGEGTYAGSTGTHSGPGGEGTFGFGRHMMMQQPRLKGPFRDPAGTFRVFNVAHQQRGPAAEADSGLGIVSWSLMLLAILVPAAVVYGRRRLGISQ